MGLQSCLCYKPVRPIRQAHGPSIFLGVLRSGVSLSNPDPSTLLRVMVRYSNHEALEGSKARPQCSYAHTTKTLAAF